MNRDNIFNKVKRFFNNVFNGENGEHNTFGENAKDAGVASDGYINSMSFNNYEYNTVSTKRTDFINSQRIITTKFEAIADSLEMGEMNISDLNEEEKVEMVKFYENRITMRREKMNILREEIAEIESALASNGVY